MLPCRDHALSFSSSFLRGRKRSAFHPTASNSIRYQLIAATPMRPILSGIRSELTVACSSPSPSSDRAFNSPSLHLTPISPTVTTAPAPTSIFFPPPTNLPKNSALLQSPSHPSSTAIKYTSPAQPLSNRNAPSESLSDPPASNYSHPQIPPAPAPPKFPPPPRHSSPPAREPAPPPPPKSSTQSPAPAAIYEIPTITLAPVARTPQHRLRNLWHLYRIQTAQHLLAKFKLPLRPQPSPKYDFPPAFPNANFTVVPATFVPPAPSTPPRITVARRIPIPFPDKFTRRQMLLRIFPRFLISKSRPRGPVVSPSMWIPSCSNRTPWRRTCSVIPSAMYCTAELD